MPNEILERIKRCSEDQPPKSIRKKKGRYLKNMELNLKEMEKVSGGSKAYELAMEFRRYVDSLEAKYQCVDGGLDYLKTVCTPEERNKIHELSEAWYASLLQ